jgi:hypothetical protein
LPPLSDDTVTPPILIKEIFFVPFQPTLQECVGRYINALRVAGNLIALHPRQKGHPGKAAALSPAIVLSVVAAFEGFAEDLTATAMHMRGRNFAQIAKRVGAWSNPTLRDLNRVLKQELPELTLAGREISIWEPPPLNAKHSIWKPITLSWDAAMRDSDGWMQVRHCLTHGLANGLGSESWPGPLRGDVSAHSVLREMRNNKHSLTLHGAISCARIYVWGAAQLADEVAAQIDSPIDWCNLPDFDV